MDIERDDLDPENAFLDAERDLLDPEYDDSDPELVDLFDFVLKLDRERDRRELCRESERMEALLESLRIEFTGDLNCRPLLGAAVDTKGEVAQTGFLTICSFLSPEQTTIRSEVCLF